MTDVYQIQNLVTGRRYIGRASDWPRCQARHIRTLEAGTHHNRALQVDWDRYGRDWFTFSLLEYVKVDGSLEPLIVRTFELVAYYRATSAGVYNHVTGGEPPPGSVRPVEETVQSPGV